MFGNRGIYHKGWTAVTRHRTPWVLGWGRKTVPLDDDVWEPLRHQQGLEPGERPVEADAEEKLHELSWQLWLIEGDSLQRAADLTHRVIEKMNPDTAGRPVLIRGNTQLLFGGMGRLSENCVLSIKNKSHSVTAEIEVPATGAEGVIIAQGANIGGWSLYVKSGKLKYCYNVAGVNHYYVEATSVLPAGDHQVRAWSSAYAGGGNWAKAVKFRSMSTVEKVGEGSIAMTQAMVFSADDGCVTVGEDDRRPRIPRLQPPAAAAFNGRVKGRCSSPSPTPPKRPDHLVSAEDAIRVAMARQ